MKREVRDELEVPGDVLIICPSISEEKKKAIEKGNEIIKWGEEHGLKKLRELPEDKKTILKRCFDTLGLKYDNLD